MATLAVSVYIVARAYTPVWYRDEWSVPSDYKALGGHYPLWKLWAQHNEHRIPITKALQLLDLFWFKGDRRPLIVCNGVIQAAAWCAISYLLFAIRKFSKPELATLFGIAAFCIFNPNQMQNFEWTFQSAFLATFMFAMAALVAISLYAHHERTSPGKNRKWLILAIGSAFLAECNLASGVLTWIMLPFCAVLLGVRQRVVALLSAAAVPGIAVFLIGYQPSPDAPDPLGSLRNLKGVAAFLVAYFAESWHYIAEPMGAAAAILAFAGLAVFAARQIQRRKRMDVLEGFAFSLAVMIMLTAFVTALGRQQLGLEQPRVSRYQTPAMLFWLAVALLAITQLSRWAGRHAPVFIVVSAVFSGFFVAEARHFHTLLEIYENDRFARDTAALALEAGIYDVSLLQLLYPKPSVAPSVYAFLVERGLMAPPFPEFSGVGKRLSEVYSVLPAGRCIGSVESLRRIAERADGRLDLFASGWGYDTGKKEGFRRVLAVESDGTITGIGVSGIDRPDIAPVHPQVSTSRTGWRLYAASERPGASLEIYGIVPGTREACPLPGRLTAPPGSWSNTLPPISSISNSLRGFVDGVNSAAIAENDAAHPRRVRGTDRVVIEGWGISPDAANAMEEVFAVYEGGQVAADAVSRSDVANLFNKDSLLMSGYRIEIPAGALRRGLQPIHLVGVWKGQFYKSLIYLQVG